MNYRALSFVFCCQLAGALTLVADDWPHWRGPNRNDVTNESSLWNSKATASGDWLKKGTLWKTKVGEGGSSPIVAGGRVYVMGWAKGRDTVSCLDATSGIELWQTSYDCPRYGRNALGDEGLYSGPTSTPEYDEATGYLYTLSCDGDLICWDTNQQGKRLWSINLYDRYHLARRPRIGRSGHRDYGYTTSPLVHENWVLVEVGADTGTIIAFDKTTGTHAWSSEATGPAGHTGGLVPITIEGIACVAVMRCYGLLVTRMDAESVGKTVAEYEWTTNFINNIATPAVDDNFVLITSAYNHNAICKLEITLGGARKLWEQSFASKVCSPVIHDGHVYWAWQKLYCLDFETGELRWQGGSFSDAGSCIVTSDDRLIVWGGRGEIVLAETAVRSPAGYTKLASVDQGFGTDVWPHVALAYGRVFLKDRSGNLVCIEIDRPSTSSGN